METPNKQGGSSKYKDLIRRSQEDQTEQERQYQEEDAKAQLQSDISATRRSLSKAEQDRDKAVLDLPFDSKRIIDAQIKVEGLQDGLKRLQDLESQLF